MLEGRIVLQEKQVAAPKEKGRIGQVNQQVPVGKKDSLIARAISKGVDSDKEGKRRLEQGWEEPLRGREGNFS